MIRGGAEHYVQTHRDGEATHCVQGVLAKLSLCRTSALGGHWYECDDCRQITKLHNSCGDRHCPDCSGSKRQDFSEGAEQLLLDGVDYYQVVFTLPEVLSTMALANRKEISDLLFHSAWKALRKTICQEQQYDPAALLVLHSWNQKLDSHWHVHALVPGGGPSLVDGSWKQAEPPPVPGEPEQPRKYLVDVINLRNAFRKFAITRLKRLRRQGKLKLAGSLEYLLDEQAWDSLVEELKGVDWCSHIEAPPSESSRPEQLVRYLTRYLTGGPISDQRILAADEQSVTFLAREGNTPGGQRQQVPHTLPTAEFVRRWCLHIQPRQLTKIRYFGGWNGGRKDEYLERCCKALGSAGVEIESEIDFNPEEFTDPAEESAEEPLRCQYCGSGSLRLIKEIAKPSWKTVFSRHSESCPRWYAESRELDDRKFWDAAMGEGFSDWYDWYLKSGTESARESDPAPDIPAAVQLPLPGLSEAGNYVLYSF